MSILTRSLISNLLHGKRIYLPLWFTKAVQARCDRISMFINLHLQRMAKECALHEDKRTSDA